MHSEVALALQALKTALDAVAQARPPGTARAPSPTQLLFESWVSRDHWHLFNEALPLLLAVDPVLWPARQAQLGLGASVAALQQALVKAALETADLPVLNPTQAQADWRVAPVDLYLWTLSVGYPVAEPYATLVQFVLQVVKRRELPRSSLAVGATGAAAREQVLGAALALLARSPQTCRDEQGLLDPALMAARLAEQSIRWFESATPPMSLRDMATLIAEWTD